MNLPPQMPPPGSTPAIIGGFGLPGRSLAELLALRGIPYVVIEMNALAIARNAGARFICGDASDPDVLVTADIATAWLVALMMPNDAAVLRAVAQARQLNPAAHIIARCAFTSTGFEALRLGANQTIVAEQLAAREVTGLVTNLLDNKVVPPANS